MPRPPILPILDWETIFEEAMDWPQWLSSAESSERAEELNRDYQGLLSSYVHAASSDTSDSQTLIKQVNVICIAEDWCGDVVRHVPVLQALVDSLDNVSLRYLHRAQNPELFARFLTLGGEAIPKVIVLSDNWLEVASWGPMPNACRRLIAQGKACGDVPLARKAVAARYAADSERIIVQQELRDLFDLAASDKSSLQLMLESEV